jgi:hypothetical protein
MVQSQHKRAAAAAAAASSSDVSTALISIAASKIPRTFHSFSELPAELKRYVLHECLVRFSPMSTRIHLMIYAPALIRIASVSQEMRAMAMEIYCGQNLFALGRWFLWSYTLHCFRQPNRTVGRYNRKIEIGIQLQTDLDTVNALFAQHPLSVLNQTEPAGILTPIHTKSALQRGRSQRFFEDKGKYANIDHWENRRSRLTALQNEHHIASRAVHRPCC